MVTKRFAEERVKTYGRNSPKGAECISEFIITVRKKHNNGDYEPSSSVTFFDGQFERYLKKKNSPFLS